MIETASKATSVFFILFEDDRKKKKTSFTNEYDSYLLTKDSTLQKSK